MARKRHQRILALLAVFVMLFCDINLLSFAEENTEAEEQRIRTICGLEEHTHTDECYEKTLICGRAESGKKTEKRFKAFQIHEHNDSCYDENGNLNCGIIEGKYYHAHNEYCYDNAGNLVCGLEEVWPHEHTDACYETEKKLICKKEETEGHKHTDACYKQNRELICEKAEDPGHHHSDACYMEHTTLTCGKQEDPGHHHSDACYTEHTELTCEKQEDPGHHHSDACYTEQTNLTCGKQEDPGHHHGDACYRDQKVLICEQEGNEDHTHTEECYTILRELICEEPERDGHTHGESCYTTTRELTCGETERDGHTHGESCYTKLRELTCGEAERDGHTHGESCYTSTRDLACRKPERDGHTHTDDCYRIWNEQICGKEEKEGHTHNESCYETQKNLICEELSTTHHHTAACWNEEGRLICGEVEVQEFVSSADRWTEEVISEGHHHTDDCYEQTLICEKEEHTHTDACYPEQEESEEPEDGSADEPPETLDGEQTEATGEASDNDGEGTGGENEEGTETKEDGETDTEDEAGEETGEENEEDTETEEDGETDSEEEAGKEAGEENEEDTEIKENEEDPDEKDGAEDAEEGDGEETDEEELTEEQGETTITAEDAPYAVSISFSGEAGIPEGTKLVVSEAGEETQAGEQSQMRFAKAAPMKSAGLRSAATPQERHVDIPSMTVWSAGEAAPDIILYQKTLDISLISEGEEIEPDPAALITVTVQLPGIEDGQKVEVRHITDGGTELLESTNDAGSITFTTSGFSLFEFISRAQALSAWSTGQTSNTFYGKTANQEAQASAVSVSDVTEGLEVLEAYSLTGSNDLWVVLQRITDIALGKMESIALYTVEDGQLGAIVRDHVSLNDMLRFNLGDLGRYALVRDTGLRHIIAELGNITLDGMMPKNSAAEATDVREEYSDPMDYEETVAAYDIAILSDGEEYQPGESPIKVSIRNDGITAALEEGKTVRLRHITDDGSREEIPYTLEDGTVSFDAAGFSAYVFSASIEKIITIDGESWKVTVEYGDDAGIPEDAELEIHEVEAGNYQAAAASAWNWTENNYIFYTKFLDISIVRDGETIEPLAPVSVTIQLLDVEAGAEALRVVHFGKDGAEAIEGQAGADGTIQFEADAFSVFGFGNALQPLASTETEEADLTIYGFDGEARLTDTTAPEVDEGLEVLGAYTLSNGESIKTENGEEETGEGTAGEENGNEETETTEENGNNQNALWIKAEMKAEANLADMESVVLCSIDGETTMPVTGELTTGGQIKKLEATNIALIKDTGYRHLNFVLEMGEDGQATAKGEIKGNKSESEETAAENIEEDAGENPEENTGESTGENLENSATGDKIIILEGMAPKAAEATVTDVTGNYAEHEYPIPEEEQGEETETEEQPGEPENGNPEEKQAAEGDETEAGIDGETEEPGRITLAAYEISISSNETEYQPSTERPIRVEIRDSRITAESNIELWHIRDDGIEEQIKEFTAEEGRVEFTSLGFSVYTIVDAKDPPPGASRILSLSEIEDGQAYTFSIYRDNNTNYMTARETGVNSTTETGTGEFIGTTSQGDAGDWFFESAGGDNQYYIYCMNGAARNYIWTYDSNKIRLDTTNKTLFTVAETSKNTGTFYIYTVIGNKNYALSVRGIKNFFLENRNNGVNANERVIITKSSKIPDDYYELDGKTYCIAYYEESVYGAGLIAEEKIGSGKHRLTAMQVLVRPDVIYNSGEMLIAQDADLSEWTFHCQGGTSYYITTEIGGETKYLTLNGDDNLTLESTPNPQKSLFTVTSGSGKFKNKYKLVAGSYSLALSGGKVTNGFVSSANGGDYAWLNLVEPTSILTDDDFVVYSAEKVDISDRNMVPGLDPQKAQIVIFSRTWNDTEKKYEYYIVNSDGSLLRAYESGSMIQWVGSEVNTALWEFTEYLDNDGTPNYFYELQNTYSGQYIAPQVTGGQILSNNTIGINLIGRRDGYYYSKILAWDESHYRYVGLKTENGRIVSCPKEDAEDFFYAIIYPVEIEDDEVEVNTVETVDHTQYGISMKMINCSSRSYMSGILGSDNSSEATLKTGIKDILSTKLTDGYPTTMNGRSLSELYSGAQEVNNLFIASTYYSGGYFSYDSSQNFASFYDEDGNYDSNHFTVYKQLGTSDSKDGPTMKHGLFLPYNALSGQYSVKNPYNLYSTTDRVNELPDSDPRKGEQLILVNGETDYYFAVELEAGFTQTANGLDNWGHDIIYEFTGDDDFWLYVDDELVIDLGGIHYALSGSVNFSTGRVVVNGTPTSLYEIFKSNCKKIHTNWTEAEVTNYLSEKFHQNSEGNWIFKDYSSHTMKIFYMERGAGSSNLRMRFNLASVKPGTVLLSKNLAGVEDEESFMAEFPFQIWYKTEAPEADPKPMRQGMVEVADGVTRELRIVYKDTNKPVKFMELYTAADGIAYENVFFLKPGEIAEFTMPSDAMQYSVKECHIDKNTYDSVTVNGNAAVETSVTGSTRFDYFVDFMTIAERPKAEFINHVDPGVLKTLIITKRLFDETGTVPIHNDTTAFTFRLYLGTENDVEIKPANMHTYHVKNPAGVYCYWDDVGQSFMPLPSGGTVFANLSSDDKTIATFTTSMYGSISRIPADYTVELQELLSGTKFMVEERSNEVPDGYSLKSYLVTEGNTQIPESATPTEYTFGEYNYSIEVCNMKGFGLRLHKEWTDAVFMSERDPVYFAVYIEKNNVLAADPVPGTLRRMQTGDETLYWYFNTLGTGLTFENYVAREVKLEGTPSVADDGTVSGYTSITPITPGDQNTVYGTQTGETRALYSYTVTYHKGELDTSRDNIREDTMINSRPGIKLQKKDMDGNSLPGAEFTLTDNNGNTVGAETFISDENGLITIAYLRQNEWYTLTETSAPAGYQAVSQKVSYHATVDPLQIRLIYNNGTYDLEVRGGDYSNYHDEPAEPGSDDIDIIKVLTIRNKQYTLQIRKTEENYETPIPDVHFALYREVKGANGWRMDYLPIADYADLVTDANGIVPEITNAFSTGALQPGTYYLAEKAPIDNYMPLENPVLFTVTKAGAVILGSPRQPGYNNPNGSVLVANDGEGFTQMSYDLFVANFKAQPKDITVKKIVEGSSADVAGLSSFIFSATLFMPDGNTVWDYDKNGFTNGKTTFTLGHNGEKVLTVPPGAVLEVTEKPNEWYDTKYQWIPTGEEPSAKTNGSTFKQTVPNKNGKIEFTNTRKKVKVTVKKELSDPLTSSGSFSFTGTLTDYNQTCTNDITSLNSFSLALNNTTSKSTSFMIPMGSTFTVTETAQDCYDTTYSSNNKDFVSTPVVLTKITGNRTITVKNTRKTKTVTVSKTLNDATESSAVSFPFTVTLYNTDGETTVNGYKLNGDSIKTGDGKNNTIAGKASFNLSVANGETVTQTLTVPYGAILKVEETVEGDKAYSTSIAEIIGENTAIYSDTSRTTAPITNDMTLAFTNELLEGNVTLTLSKTVVNDYTDSTEGEFEFAVSGLETNSQYKYILQTYNGIQWTGDTQVSKKTNGEGTLTFTLQHNHRVVIEIPVGEEVTVTETNSAGFTPNYRITHVTNETSTPEDPVSENSTGSLLMNGNKIVDFTNTREPVAPTGYLSRHIPYLLITAFSFLLLIIIGGAGIMRKRRVDGDDDPTDPDTPPGFNTGYPVMNKETYDEKQTPWKKSPQGYNGFSKDTGGYPPAMGSYRQARGAPLCPKENLWTQIRGSSRKRGGPEE